MLAVQRRYIRHWTNFGTFARHHVTDRPVYGFRAKGFNAAEGETPFTNLEEVFETYKAAIKKRQPKGPYAIAGYSFGGMVAVC